MKEMSPEDKQRIEKEAEHWMQNLDPLKMHPYHGYVTGATAEHERMAELLKEQIELVSTREAEQDVMAADTVRLMDQIEYQKKALKEDYDKITKLEFELKETVEALEGMCKYWEWSVADPDFQEYKRAKAAIEKAKGKSQ